MTRPTQITGLINSAFDFRSWEVTGVKYDDHYSKVTLDKIDDIYVEGEISGMSLKDKYERLSEFPGFIHTSPGLSLEIECQRVKSMRLTDQYVKDLREMTQKDVEAVLGVPDKLLIDGIAWVTDFVDEARVMVYDKLKLHVHIDSVTASVIEIRFGDVDTNGYE